MAEAAETEYQPYLKGGTGAATGEALLVTRVGVVVKAAGRAVTLDPATAVGTEWWDKTGRIWAHRSLTPPSPAFAKARRTVMADADGKFEFSGLPSGEYYVRTEVTWKVGNYNSIQGGLVGQRLKVREGQTTAVVLNQPLP